MSMGVGQAGLFRYGNGNPYEQQNNRQVAAPVQRISDNPAKKIREEELKAKQAQLEAKRRVRHERPAIEVKVDADGHKTFEGKSAMSTITSSQDYSQALQSSRAKSKDTALNLKKLRYNFKSISSQLMRSKTSSSARQVAAKAKREVTRLKRLKQGGEYDDEELSAAIAHAQAMERVAKKKVKHLIEEEMVKVTGGPCMDEVEDDQKDDVEDMDEAKDENAGDMENAQDAALPARELLTPEDMELSEEEYAELIAAQMENMRDFGDQMMESLSEVMEMQAPSSIDEMMSDMMEDMWDSMNEMFEEMGLSDLADSMFGGASEEMDPADLKMMKIKHRCKELKEITKADSDYLKVIFDKMQKQQASGGAGAAIAAAGAQSPSLGGAVAAPSVDISACVDVSAGGGGFDVCV